MYADVYGHIHVIYNSTQYVHTNIQKQLKFLKILGGKMKA